MSDDGSQLTRDAYAGVEVELPTGDTVRCNAIPMSHAIRFLELLEKAAKSDLAAMREIMEEFPKAVGAGDSFEQLLPGEFFDTVMRFFGIRRPKRTAPQKKPTSPSAGPSGSTT